MLHVYHVSNSSNTKEANIIFTTNVNDDGVRHAHWNVLRFYEVPNEIFAWTFSIFRCFPHWLQSIGYLLLNHLHKVPLIMVSGLHLKLYCHEYQHILCFYLLTNLNKYAVNLLDQSCYFIKSNFLLSLSHKSKLLFLQHLCFLNDCL